MFKKVIGLSGALAIAQLVNFIAMTLGSKLFGPEVFGQSMFVNSVSLTLAVVMCLRGDHFILAKDKLDLEKTINTFISISLSILAIVLFLVFIWGLVSSNYKFTALVSLGVLMGFVNSNFQLLGSSLIKTEKLKAFSFSAVIKPAVMCIGQLIVFALAPLFSLAMILPRFVGDISAAAARYFSIKNERFAFDTKKVSFIKENYTYCIVGTLASFLNIFSQQLPMLILPALFGYTSLGYFSLAFSLVVIPMTLLLSPLRSLLIKEYAGGMDNEKIFNKFTLLLIPISILCVLITFFLAEPLVLVVWGDDWLETAVYIKLISIWAASGLINAPSFSYIISTEKQKYLLYLETLFIVIKFLILFGIYVFNIDLLHTCILIVLSGVFYNIILIIFAKVKVYNECNKKNML